jgi:hypothetical protein
VIRPAWTTSVARGGPERAHHDSIAIKQYSQPMGLRPGINLDKALQLAAALEDEEIVRKIERRK